MVLRPCITCGRPTSGSRCPAHTLRNGSTRSWRRIRAQILALDNYRCQICDEPATEVDHIRPVADGGTHHRSNGTHHRSNLRSLCHEHHAACHAER
jgi:5-methylcytosine-specific restriction endonuclease McrA